MAVTKSAGRQTPLVASLKLTYADLGAAATGPDVFELFDMPPGSRLTGGFAEVITAFNHGTSAVLDIGDNDAGTGPNDPDRYTSTAFDLTAVAGTRSALDLAGVATNVTYNEGDTIDGTYTAVGTTATAGEVLIVIEYMIDSRSTETQDR